MYLPNSNNRNSNNINFSNLPGFLIVLLIGGVSIIVGANFIVDKIDDHFRDKELARLKQMEQDSVMIDNGDGSSSTSLASMMDQNLVKIKDIGENRGKLILTDKSYYDLNDKILSFKREKKLKLGGKAYAEVEIIPNFQYICSFEPFKYSSLETGAVHIQVPKEAFGCIPSIKDHNLISSKLNLSGGAQNLFNRKEDFEVVVINEAKNAAKKQIEDEAEKSLSRIDLMQELQNIAEEQLKSIYKPVGVDVYISFE